MLFSRHLASKVLPVPGGPYSITPLGGLMSTRMKSSGLVKGNSITWWGWEWEADGSSENKNYSWAWAWGWVAKQITCGLTYFGVSLYFKYYCIGKSPQPASHLHTRSPIQQLRDGKILNIAHIHPFLHLRIQPHSLARRLPLILTSLISRIWSLRPPMLLHVMSPGSSVSMPCTDGSTSFGSTRITAKVVRSIETRTWPFNFSFSI